MKSIFKTLDNFFFGRHQIFDKAFLCLVFLFGFSTIYLDRPKLSVIAASIVVVLFFISLVSSLLKRDIHLWLCMPIVAVIITIPFFSNLVAKKFDYDFIILAALFFSGFQYYIKNKSTNLYKLIISLGSGFSIGSLLIVFHYIRVGFANKMDMFFGNVDGVSGITSTIAVILLVTIYLLAKNKNNNYYFFLYFLLVPLLLISFIFLRIGPVVKIFIGFFVFFSVLLYKKNRYLVFIPVALLFTLLVIVLFTDIGSFFNRFRLSIYQIINLNVFVEGSVRERLSMLVRDIDYALRYAFIGHGKNTYLAYNLTPSHNAFGTISENYGSLLLIILMVVSILPVMFSSNKKNRIFAITFLSLTIYSVVYGTCFISRYHYLILGTIVATSIDNLGVKALSLFKKNNRKAYDE